MFQFLPEHRRLSDTGRHNVTRRPAICEPALPRTELRATTQGSAEPPQLSQPVEHIVATSPPGHSPQARSPGSQDVVAAAFARSRDRVSTARRLFQRCRHLSDLGGVLKHLPHNCRGTNICCEAYQHAARLHEGMKRYRKRNNKVCLHGHSCPALIRTHPSRSLDDMDHSSSQLLQCLLLQDKVGSHNHPDHAGIQPDHGSPLRHDCTEQRQVQPSRACNHLYGTGEIEW